MKTFFKNINTDNDKNILKQYIDNQKIPFSICIGDVEKVKSYAQLRYFNKLVNEFARIAQEQDLSDLSSGDWKAEIKRQAHFYQANTGITSLPKITKNKMWVALKTAKDSKGNKLFDEYELSMIVDCFNEMKLKSCKDADTKEMITLITEAHILILDVLNTNNNIMDILQIEGGFHSLLMNWYNNYINSSYCNQNPKEDVLRAKYEELGLDRL